MAALCPALGCQAVAGMAQWAMCDVLCCHHSQHHFLSRNWVRVAWPTLCCMTNSAPCSKLCSAEKLCSGHGTADCVQQAACGLLGLVSALGRYPVSQSAQQIIGSGQCLAPHHVHCNASLHVAQTTVSRNGWSALDCLFGLRKPYSSCNAYPSNIRASTTMLLCRAALLL